MTNPESNPESSPVGSSTTGPVANPDDNGNATAPGGGEFGHGVHDYVVVVGVSDTSNSPTALKWALDQALSRGGRLVAVRASHVGGTYSSTGYVDLDAPSPLDPEREKLKADVESVLGEGVVEGPDAVVDVRVFRGETSRVLRNVAKHASLLVLDAPRSPVTQPLLAPRVVYNVECPVVLMPPSISGEPPRKWQRAMDSMGRAIARGTGTAGRPGLGRHL